MTKPVALSVGIGSAGLVCLALAVVTPPPTRWILVWTALSCALVSMAYALNLPSLFGKTAGRLPWQRRVLLGPYLLAFSIACQIMRRYREAEPLDEVMADLYVGGRIRSSDVPHGTGMVVDLVAEFGEPAAIRERPGYRCLPILDGGYPRDEVAFAGLVDEVAACRRPVLIHCDSGKGRAPMFAALVLVRRGLADDPEAAVDLVRRGRPATAPTASDMAFARRVLPHIRSRACDAFDDRMRA